MLYDHWQQIAREHRTELALWDLAAGGHWTFGELAQAAERAGADRQPVVYAQGNSAEFIFAVLRAWRGRSVLCPLEPDQKPPPVPLPPEPCSHLKLTSATSSGQPRVVALTAEQLAADAGNIVATMGLRREWPNLGAISMAHSYGFSNLVLPLLLHGIPLILVPSPLPEMVRRGAEGFGALTLAGVPALWRAWHEAGAIPPNVRLALSAGAPLSVSLERAVFKARGLKIHNFYGSSECGGIAYDRTDVPRLEEACVGGPMQQVALTLNPDGLLVVRSRAVGETYWPEREAALGGGSFQTNDLAELKDGLVYLRGRAGDQINVAGRKVSPAALEQALREHEAVVECLVFGVGSGDAERSDLIVACVVARGRATAGELKQFLLRKLPGWQVPREWWFVDSLGANSRGKLSRWEWRRRFLEMKRAG